MRGSISSGTIAMYEPTLEDHRAIRFAVHNIEGCVQLDAMSHALAGGHFIFERY